MAFGFLVIERRLFVVTCKKCRRDVPSGVKEFPFQSITVECPLCGELAPPVACYCCASLIVRLT